MRRSRGRGRGAGWTRLGVRLGALGGDREVARVRGAGWRRLAVRLGGATSHAFLRRFAAMSRAERLRSLWYINTLCLLFKLRLHRLREKNENKAFAADLEMAQASGHVFETGSFRIGWEAAWGRLCGKRALNGRD